MIYKTLFIGHLLVMEVIQSSSVGVSQHLNLKSCLLYSNVIFLIHYDTFGFIYLKTDCYLKQDLKQTTNISEVDSLRVVIFQLI